MALTTSALPVPATRNSITLALLITARVMVSLLRWIFRRLRRGNQASGGPVRLVIQETERLYVHLRLALRG